MPDGDGDRFAPDDDSTVLGCDVTSDREGHWVELTVGFRDDVVRRRIGPYLTERIATVAAEHIRRAAGRQAPPPTGQ
jgi:hypothetical protein